MRESKDFSVFLWERDEVMFFKIIVVVVKYDNNKNWYL